jgi:Mg/Co/Ni transporter MgtE
MELTIQALEKLAPEDLANAINELIKNDFSKLVQLLYRIDVSEAKLKYILQAHPNEDAGKLIAAVVIERLTATKKAREMFSTPKEDDSIDQEERL